MTARTESRGPGEVPRTRKRFIYFDEHGNTGERLLDPNQPFFVLASNDFTTPEARDLAAGLLNQGAVEAKFTTLKKTPAGRSRLTRLLVDPRLNSSRVAVFAVDKEFMVFTKLVDIVMETLLHERGVDLYRDGANLATANMMYCVVPAFCGRTATAAMLEAFVGLVRHRRPEDERQYLEAGEALIAACQDEEMRNFLSPFFRAEFMPLWLEDLPEDSLDPAIPSLFRLIDTWGRRKTERFQIIHDRSKPIIASEDQFLQMMAQAEEVSTLAGYDRRKFLFPLRADGLQHGDSAAHPQLQIADVCAGVIAHYVRSKREGRTDKICEVMDATNAIGWVVDAMAATTDVTPEALGTDDASGSNPIEPFVRRPSRA